MQKNIYVKKTNWLFDASLKRLIIPFGQILKVMKLVLFLLITAGCLQVSATSTAQQITLRQKNITLEHLFEQIHKQTGVQFVYSNNLLEEAKKVSINVKRMPLKEVLNTAFKDQSITYQLMDDVVVLKERKREFISEEKKLPPPIEVTGKVTDSSGASLAGVTISVKGAGTGAVTDANGNYSLTVEDDATLIVSFVGFRTQEVDVDGRTNIDFTLSASVSELDQLVVVGYGTQKKQEVTGSVATISNDDLTRVPLGNVTNSLAGKLPGLMSVQGSGEPGADAASLSIRGFGSPLVVVDGIEGRSFDQLDPNEIESITVLKDAASTAVYGVSGGNGVILVTTKKGLVGRPKLNYSFNYGLQRVTRYPDFVNSEQYATLKNEASINSGGNLIYSPEEIEKYREGTDPNYPNFDYYHYFLRDYSPQLKQNLSIRGGSEKIRYFFMLGALKQDAMWRGDQNFSRYNFRSNVDADITRDLRVSVQFDGRYELRNSLIQDSYLMASWLQYSWPIEPPKTPDGMIKSTNYGLTAYLDKDLTGYIKDKRRRINANISIIYDVPFIKGLTAKMTASRDVEFGDIKDWEKKYLTYEWDEDKQTSIVDGSRGENFLTLSTASITRTHLQPSLEYKNSFSDKHNVKALLLFDQNETESDNFSATRTGYVVPIDQIFAGPDLNKNNSGGAFDDGRESIVGRLNYNYAEKYLLEYSFRYDGSARFPRNKRWGYFQGGSAGWRISEEPFALDYKDVVSNLMLRASWGELGDDETGQFQFLTGFTYPSNSYIFGRDIVTNGMVSSGIANPNITWEVSKTLNLGVDIELWNGLVSASLDVFNRNRSGLLAKRDLQLPSTFGAVLPDENLNSDNTKGFEFLVSHRNHFGPFEYNISFNTSFSKSTWRHVEEADFNSQYDRWVNGLENRYKNRFFGLKAIGQFESVEEIKNSPIQDDLANSTLRPGDIKYEDFNNDGVIDDNDRQPLGRNNTPEVFFGSNINLSWRNFNLVMNWQGATNFSIEEQSFLIAPFFNGMNAYAYLMDRWHREDMEDPDSKWIPGKFPSTINSGAPNNMKVSSFWLKNVTYLRLKSLNLSYRFNNLKALDKIGIDDLTLSFSSYNLFTFTNVPYIDPEAPSGRLSYYPQQKIFNFGVSVQF